MNFVMTISRLKDQKTPFNERCSDKINILLTVFLISLCLSHTKSTNEAESFLKESKFISDYVDYFKIDFVYIVDGGTQSTRESWSLRLLTYLCRQKPIFLSVLRINKDTETLVSNVSNEVKMTSEGIALQRRMLADAGTHIIVCRLRSEQELNSFKKIFSIFYDSHDWLLITDKIRIKRLKEIYLPISSKVTLASFSPTSQNVMIWEAYQASEDLEQIKRLAGRWEYRPSFCSQRRSKDNFNCQNFEATTEIPSLQNQNGGRRSTTFRDLKSDPVEKRTDLSGLHLRCVTIESRPLTNLHPQPDGVLEMDGVFASLFKTMANYTNFTYTCHKVSDGQWGSYENGSWTGLIGTLAANEADIAVAPLDITLERAKVVDFLAPILSSGYKIFMKRPANQDQTMTAYTKHLSSGVWIVVAATIVEFSLMIYIVLKCSPRDSQISVLEVFSVMASFACAQGTWLKIHSLSGRILTFVIQIFQVLLMAHYSSNLVSSLSTGPPQPSLNTLEDIAYSPHLTFGYIRGMAITEYLQNTLNPAYRSLYEKIENNNFAALSTTLEEGLQRVLKEPYTFMEWEVHLNYKYGGDCRLYILPHSYFKAQSSFAIRKGSPLVPLFNKIIMDMKTYGFLDKWWNEWKPQEQDCLVLYEAIKLNTIIIPIMVLGIALGLSLLFLIAECCYTKRSRRFSIDGNVDKTNFYGDPFTQQREEMDIEMIRGILIDVKEFSANSEYFTHQMKGGDKRRWSGTDIEGKDTPFKKKVNRGQGVTVQEQESPKRLKVNRGQGSTVQGKASPVSRNINRGQGVTVQGKVSPERMEVNREQGVTVQGKVSPERMEVNREQGVTVQEQESPERMKVNSGQGSTVQGKESPVRRNVNRGQGVTVQRKVSPERMEVNREQGVIAQGKISPERMKVNREQGVIAQGKISPERMKVNRGQGGTVQEKVSPESMKVSRGQGVTVKGKFSSVRRKVNRGQGVTLQGKVSPVGRKIDRGQGGTVYGKDTPARTKVNRGQGSTVHRKYTSVRTKVSKGQGGAVQGKETSVRKKANRGQGVTIEGKETTVWTIQKAWIGPT